jgi:hypothetical protein
MAYFALLAFCGLLRPPLPRSSPNEWPRRALAKSAATPTVKLNAIELALLAELSLEQARAHDQLVDDPAQRPEIRRSAAATAGAWRERARAFQSQAFRQSAAPIAPDVHAYSGPERRTGMRRRETRRTGPAPSVGRQPGDRRGVPDRRRGDRRRPELASR